MKINLDQEIIGVDGIKPLPNHDKEGIPLTLKDV